MIIKGASRAGPKQLANHLLRADTNERVEVLELHSPIGELHEAFRDWQTLATGTRGSKGLYHANIDPAKGYEMTRDQWLRSVEVLEKELGLEGQPRAVVLHEKNGREHIHVVWQRTDPDTMTLVSDGWNYKAHERASQALELEFGHEPVPGKHEKRDREQQPEPPKADITHAEWQQKERTGIDPRDRQEKVTNLYEQSDNGQAFRAALADEGYILAKGDRRDFVLVDEHGEIHSLSRQVKGHRAAEIKEFLTDLDPASVPTIEQARQLQADRPPPEPEPPPQPEQQTATQKPPEETEEARRFREALEARQGKETQKLLDEQRQEAQAARDRMDGLIKQKIDRLSATQADARRHLEEAQRAEETILTRVDRKVRPELHAERDRQNAAAREALEQQQREKRQAELTRLRQARDRDLDRMAQRHAKELAELRTEQARETERYREEREAAERHAREMEERRRLEQEKKRSRDGPDSGPTR